MLLCPSILLDQPLPDVAPESELAGLLDGNSQNMRFDDRNRDRALKLLIVDLPKARCCQGFAGVPVGVTAIRQDFPQGADPLLHPA